MGQDSRDRTARTGQPGQESQDRTAETGQPGQDSRDRTARTGQQGLSSWGQKRIGQLKQDSQRTVAIIYRGRKKGTERPHGSKDRTSEPRKDISD